MRVIRETCVAGKVIDISVRVSSGRHKGKRESRQFVSPESVQKNNDRLAAKTLARIINANQGPDWSHTTLTYREEPDPEEAKKELSKFMARMRYAMKKEGKEFKWIVATEYKGHRLHHHILTNAPKEMMEKKWKAGWVLSNQFDNNPDKSKLAEYIIKESKNAFRDEESPFGTRYSHSRNLIIPEVKIEEVSERLLWDDPKAWKGYFIDKDSVRRYEHPITGLEHLEYRMIADTEEPRIKKYYKGRKKLREEDFSRYINYSEEQMKWR